MHAPFELRCSCDMLRMLQLLIGGGMGLLLDAGCKCLLAVKGLGLCSLCEPSSCAGVHVGLG